MQIGSNPKFFFHAGGVCDPGDSHENDIILYAKIEGRKEHFTLDTLSYSSYKVQMRTVVPDDPPYNSQVEATSIKNMLGTEDSSLCLPPQEITRFF